MSEQSGQEFFVPTVCQSMHITAMEKNKQCGELELFGQTCRAYLTCCADLTVHCSLP